VVGVTQTVIADGAAKIETDRFMSSTPRFQSGGSHRQLAFQLAALSAVGPFCIDAYLPSMPEIAATFSVSLLAVQQTLTAYMIPFALMTLWHGAISDAFGRRRVVLMLLSLFSLASLGCALAPTYGALVFFRAMQGLTAGAGMVIGRAIVRDVIEGPEAQRMMALVATIFAVAPAIAPVIGGWLHHWFGWRAVFVFMTVFSTAVAWWCWSALPETLSKERRQPFHPAYLVKSYWKVWTTLPFIAVCLALAAAFSGFFVYVLSAPVFLMKHLHVSETGFLWLFGPATVGMLCGATLSGRLAGRLKPLQTVALGCALMATASALNVLLNLLVPPGLPWSVLPLFVYTAGMSTAMPSLTILGIDLFPQQRGLAASCQSFIQSGGNSVVSVLAALVWGSTLSLAVAQVVFLGLCVACVAAYRLTMAAKRRAEVASEEGR
jgi:DHA1 family bicyclomycin/chloramphenicol resistance-like MFS transporter